MAIPDEFIQELKARTDITDVVSSYVNLKKAGRNMVGLCPFHNEKTPSFSVSQENGFFYCFGCGAGGDVITFIKRIENLDYVDAIKFLAQRAGMTVPEDNKNEGLSKLKNRIYEANREAARFYHKQLYTPQGQKALDYLRKRQLSEKTIIHFGLGYSPPSRFELVNYLKSKGFSGTELIAANLANESRNGNPFDRFSDRVMFPIIDLRGNVIAFGGRIMSDIKPKYLNTSDTPVFNKSRNLFALQFAKNKANGQLILVEGYMDVIALHQAGFENAVATLGTSLTQEQALIIKRYCDEVVICYDADEAGQKATARAISILRPTGLNIKILTVPDGKDPDEYIKSHGEQGSTRFRMLLEKCGNDVEYRLQKLRMSYNTDITQQRVEFLTEAAKVIAALDNSIEQDIYISSLAQELNVEKSAIRQQVARYNRRNTREAAKKEQREISNAMSARNDKINTEKFYNLRAANAEEALIALVIFNPDIANTICSKTSPDKFITSFNRKVYDVVRTRVLEGKDVSPADISGEFSNDEMSQIAKILAAHPREKDPARAAEEYLIVLDEEAEKMTPEQIAQADAQTLMEQLRKMKEKKK
ncbi:MAG: DNA primase [Acutalibacteraceae bacterium]